MIGLEYICKAYNVEFKEIAQKLDIKPQTINSWLRGRRKIPIERLKQLQKIFHFPGEYFQKELSESEKLKIQREKIKKEFEREIDIAYKQENPIDIEETDYNTGETYNREVYPAADQLVDLMNGNDFDMSQKINIAELIENISDNIEHGGEYDEMQDRSNLYNMFYNVMKNRKVTQNSLEQILSCLRDDEIWNEETEFQKEFIELLKKHKIKK
ncbi:MAG TPA: hypothetical protein DEP72_03815 [Clostridiales bacterium]|nr:MAG: hypothetical protein A2Y18_05255 [Clostridiales bacterium GWD2_32_19]HCC07281.1 hypothetical protein [Clostridiales bacterium]